MKIGRKRLKSIITPIIVFIGFFCLLYFTVNKNAVEVSGAANSYLKFPGFNPNAELGSESNPFIILEIVPHRSMGQIGYIVGGQEPIDIYAVNGWEIDSFAQGTIRFGSDGTVLGSNEIFKKKILDLDAANIDNYKIRVVTITPDALNANVQKFSKYYDLADNGKNHKILTIADSDNEIDLIANADLIFINPMIQGGSGLVDKWNAYGRDLTGKESTKTSFKDSGNDLSWQTTMELFMKVGVVEKKAPLIFDYRILNTDDVRLKLMSGDGKVEALNINGNNGKKPGFNGNVYKLCLMLEQFDPVRFFKMYLNPDGVTEGAKIIYDNVNETGKIQCINGSVNAINNNSCLYWSDYTFLPKDASGNKVNTINNAYKNYLNSNDIIVYDFAGANNYHDAVVRNVFHFNGGSSLVQVFDDITRDDLCVKDDRDGRGFDFSQDFFDWLETDEGRSPRPTKATPLEAVKYIVNMSLRTRVYKNIRILELQPCKDFRFIDESGNSAEKKVKTLFPDIQGNIIVDRQTTSEFIGKLDDLITMYDMIYIGTRTGMMKTDTSSGKTIYNDPALDGLIYLHVGDRVIAHDVLFGSMKNSSGSPIKARDNMNLTSIARNKIMKGLSSNSWNDGSYKTGIVDFYRFSGNDITSIKYEELLQFVDAKLPVLLEGNLMADDRTINNSVVDDSSYIYKFLNNSKTKSNVFDLDNIGSNRSSIISLLAKDKLTISMDASDEYRPREYDGTPGSRLSGNLNFKFRINNPTDVLPDSNFEWELFIDSNADGKFDDAERINSSLINPTPGFIKANTLVTASVNLGTSFTDVVPWLIKVRKTGQPAGREVIRAEERGVVAFTQTGESNKTKIYILQIKSVDSPYSNGHNVNLEKLIKQPNGGKETLFHKYTKDLQDFELVIETIGVDTFLDYYTTTTFDPANPQSTSRFVRNLDGKIRYYDMLLFGFGDCYDDISKPKALADITHFINTGRSVMFTHDTTSIMNQPKASFNAYNLGSGYAYWGYGINQYFRNVIGQDRFGVVKKLSDTTTPYDNANMPSQARIEPYFTMYKGSLVYPEQQGITNNALVTKYNPKGDTKLHNANKDYPSVIYGNNFQSPSDDNAYVTEWVSVVNEGQITSYPYNIPEKFKIAKSHTQYYQLNMDDPDITVWYCLNDDNASGKGTYSTTHNDVRNNYYIYSKNNIMYTVVGHSQIDAEYTGTSSYGIYEVQLFINTMIAAYQSGITGPSIRITNPEASVNSSSEYVIIENSDLFETGEVPVPYKIVKFIADDTSLNDHVIKVYKFDTAGNHIQVYPEIYSVDDNQIATLISSGYKVDLGREYYFKLPLGISSEYKNDGKASFYISVTDVSEGITVGNTAHIKPIKLFMLD